MKKFLFTLVGVAVCLTSCNNTAKDSAEEGERERDSLMQVLDQKNSELDDLVSSINEIQDGFRRINEAEGRVTIANSSPESTSTKETIRENIAYIQDAMEKNREMIAQLQQKLKTSSFNVSSLEKTLESLKQQMEEKDASIQELRAAIMEKDSLILVQDNKINDLNSDVSALSADNKQKAATVASQDKELNKAWFVFGTKAELKEQKILANNDVLRSDDFNRNYFTEVDIRTLKEINLYSKKAELLTSHPEGSYTLKKNSSGEYVLTVTNAKKFWSVSHYLVILVK